MRKQWQKILSVLLSALLVTALIPPVAAATLTTEAGKVVLQPEEGEVLYGVGEGLVAQKEIEPNSTARVSFYPVGSDGSVQGPMQYTLGPGGFTWDNSNYFFGGFNGWAMIDASTGAVVWQESEGKEYKDFDRGYVIYQTGPETYGLHDLDAKKDYNLPSSLVRNLYGYGEGKVILADKNNNNYYYYDLTTGQDAFPERHFLSGTPFSEGYARIMDENYNLCILDSNGNIVSSKEIAGGGFGEMSEGLFREWEGGYGYVDQTGAVVIPHEYEEAEEFHNGYARATVAGDVYGLIERSTGAFIELNMNILTQASPAGTVWVANEWDNPRTAYLIRIADAKAAPIQLSAVKFVPYSKQIVEWGEGYELVSAEGLPDGMAVNSGVLSGVPGQAGTYDISVSVKAGDQLQLRRYALTVVENGDAAVDNSISDGYEIETYIPDTVTGEQDQIFTIDDTVTSDAGNNYNRFLDVYLDGVKLKGGKVADPSQVGADWEYYAMEGSTKITIYSKTFQNKPEGTHTISATFQSIDKIPGKVDTVSQNFELKRPAQPDTPQPVNPGTGVKVGDVVKFTGNTHYYTSYDATGWKCLPGEALVTRIFERGKHQYHLIATEGGGSTVYGWVDFSDIAGTQEGGTPPAVEGRIVKGSRVMVKAGAKTYTGGSLASFVYKITYTVISIKGDRVVIGLNGVTTAAMNVNDLILVG